MIHVVESDDLYLEAQEDVFWFDLLRDLDWPSLRPVAARYYEALWQFNEQQARARAERSATTAAANPETPEEATYRLLFERPTLCEDAPILHEPEMLKPSPIRVVSGTLRPGRTPPRFAGRAPKCFFAMFKAFMGVAVCGTPPEPQHVRQKLSRTRPPPGPVDSRCPIRGAAIAKATSPAFASWSSLTRS
ncbi:MAG TPA: hypothetical protein VM182_00185 [Terriglobia bacterium]|nr:hypothetical protein [Terriglobia bacterium]